MSLLLSLIHATVQHSRQLLDTTPLLLLTLFDKAARDLQTPFNKALFSWGLIPPNPLSHAPLLSHALSLSLFHPSAICLSHSALSLPVFLPLPPPAVSLCCSLLCPPLSLCSRDQTSISPVHAPSPGRTHTLAHTHTHTHTHSQTFTLILASLP